MSARIPLWLASQGLYVFPLRPGSKFPFSSCNRCRARNGNEPNPLYVPHKPTGCQCIADGRLCHGLYAATINRDLITSRWERTPDAGIAVTCGPSNTIVLDVDNHDSEHPADGVYVRGERIDGAGFVNGYDTFAALCELRGVNLPWVEHPTLTVRTPSGGLQAWYRVPDGHQWRQGNGVKSGLGWQIDIKAGASFGILPGTRTSKGAYEPLGDTRTIAELPEWLRRELVRAGRWIDPNPRRTTGYQPNMRHARTSSRYVTKAIENELAVLAAAQPGALSETLNKCSYAIGRFVGARLVSESEAQEAITAAAAAAGISPDERKAQSTIRHGLTAGSRNPRTIGAAR
ncbi:bifunctional DNA primase/polymerase [Streptomyces sp. NBC_00012]|uniref:bifunctional DNA primase/polymerase n=1 Tax=Streptomyces sp. NBC_00012 TaxID=2975621 RepID=UPI003252AF65